MNRPADADFPERARLQFLARVIDRECRDLQHTDRRLFATAMTVEQAQRLDADHDLAERVEAFVARFGRLQDTLGDKLLPQLLRALQERPGSALDNLDRAERLGWIESTDSWIAIRQLRNQMIHEYIEDPAVLVNALERGHRFVPTLLAAADAMRQEMRRRGFLS